MDIAAENAIWQDLWVLATEISWENIRTFDEFGIAAKHTFEVLDIRFESEEKQINTIYEWGFVLRQNGLFRKGLAYVNEKAYSWIADIPDTWGRAKQDVMFELDKILNIPGDWGKFILSGAKDHENAYEPIRTNRFIDIERKHRFLDRYARWPEVVNSAYGKYPFLYHDNGTEKAAGLDHFIQILKLRYSQSMSVFALYKRLANEGLIDLEKITKKVRNYLRTFFVIRELPSIRLF